MYRRITACFLVMCLLIAAAPVNAGAVAQQTVTAESVTTAAGNTVRVAINAENFDAVATLEVYVYYDSSVLTLTSASTGYFLSGASNSVNTNDPGKVKLVAMNPNGISGNGTLMTLQFQTPADAEPGTYPLTVAIGNAWGTDLKPVTIGSKSGSVVITEPVETEPFSIYGYPSQTTLQKGDILSYRVASAGYRPFVSGDFLITYDHELFVFESVALESPLLSDDALYSVNSSALGQVRITYAKNTPVQTFYLLTVKLKVIADTDTTTTIGAQASNMYRENLSAYLPASTSRTLTLQKLPEVVDYPNAFLRTERLVVGNQSKSIFYLEKGANVAAADFKLTYDPSVLRCVSVTASAAVAGNGGMVIINDNFTDGSICFSYVNMEAYDDTDLPIVEITWEPIQSPGSHYQVTVSSEDVVDPQQGQVQLEHITDTGCIYAISVVAPGCTEEGYTEYRCNDCGDGYKNAYVDATGHTEVIDKAVDPTCSKTGLTEGKHCSVCGEVLAAQTVVDALGHSFRYQLSEEPSFSAPGSIAGTCSRCQETTTVELPSLNTSDYEYRVTTAPTCTVNGTGHYTWKEITYGTFSFEVTIDATGHADADGDGKCDGCGAALSKGDLDLDGDVDAYDLTALARHVGGIELITGQALLNADVDGDGDVDAYDLTKHARYVGGIITDWDQE